MGRATQNSPPPDGTLRVLAQRLRRRAVAQIVVRALAWSTAIALVTAIWSSSVVDVLATPAEAHAAWVAILLAPVMALVMAVRTALGLTEVRLATRIARNGQPAGHRLVGALQLDRQAGAAHSPELVQAHLRSVATQLSAVPASHVLPWSRATRRPMLALVAGLATCGTLLWLSPTTAGGLRALLNPATQLTDGSLVAPLVRHAKVQLVYPSYLRRPPTTLQDPTEISAPRGTTIELSIETIAPLETLRLRTEDGDRPLRRVGGAFVGTLVVRGGGPLRLVTTLAEQEFADSTVRRLVVTEDHAPRLQVVEPSTGSAVSADHPIDVQVQAHDDEGVGKIALIVRLPSGTVHRQTIWSRADLQESARQVQARTRLDLGALGLRPGDRFSITAEGTDSDAISGPNVGQSAPVELTVISDAQTLSSHLPRLKEALSKGVVALADRLEAPAEEHSPEPPPAVRRQLLGSTREFLNALKAVIEGLKSEASRRNFAADDLSGMRDRLDGAVNDESGSQQASRRAVRRRRRLHTGIVKELEGDVLRISDLLAQAHVNEAQALTAELQELRTRMQQLLTQLSEADSELAKSELLAELARAENRLRELMRSMADLSTQVPSEFVNEEAVQSGASESTMADLRKSVMGDDMDAAAKHLDSLEKQLSSLSQQLQSGGLRFRKARFGPRDKAMAEARDALGILQEQQQRLAQRSADTTRQIMGRSPTQGANTGRALEKLASKVQSRLNALDESSLGTTDRDVLAQAKQRMADARDALAADDLGAAARMASAGRRAIDRMKRNLDLDARMFPGHDGANTKNATRADRASSELAQLERRLNEALPDLNEQASADDRADMRRSASDQERARARAGEIKKQLGRGPDGLPLSPSSEEGFDQVQDAMRRAEHALRRGDSQSAALAQQEAADKLKGMGEQLAQQQQPGHQPRQTGQGDGRPAGPSASAEKVDIPNEAAFEAPAVLRRRLLDAMREDSPSGYEDAVRRYYQELLR